VPNSAVKVQSASGNGHFMALYNHIIIEASMSLRPYTTKMHNYATIRAVAAPKLKPYKFRQ